MGTILAITQVGQLLKAWAGPGSASARHPAALGGGSGSPSADPTRLSQRKTQKALCFPAPNTQTKRPHCFCLRGFV